MPESCHICVLPVDESLLPAMLKLDVLSAQRGYVGNIANLIADAAVCPDAGFRDSAELYHGGGSHSQHLLLCQLP